MNAFANVLHMYMLCKLTESTGRTQTPTEGIGSFYCPVQSNTKIKLCLQTKDKLNIKENKQGNASTHYYMTLAIVIKKETSPIALLHYHRPDLQSLGSPTCSEDLQNLSSNWEVLQQWAKPTGEVSKLDASRSSLLFCSNYWTTWFGICISIYAEEDEGSKRSQCCPVDWLQVLSEWGTWGRWESWRW